MGKPIPLDTANNSVTNSFVSNQSILHGVPQATQQCYKFMEISLPLILVGKLCVQDMRMHFNECHVKVYSKDGELVIRGYCDSFNFVLAI